MPPSRCAPLTSALSGSSSTGAPSTHRPNALAFLVALFGVLLVRLVCEQRLMIVAALLRSLGTPFDRSWEGSIDLIAAAHRLAAETPARTEV